jgi:hypothetical protein
MYYKTLISLLTIQAIGSIGITLSKFSERGNYIQEIKMKKNENSTFF